MWPARCTNAFQTVSKLVDHVLLPQIPFTYCSIASQLLRISNKHCQHQTYSTPTHLMQLPKIWCIHSLLIPHLPMLKLKVYLPGSSFASNCSFLVKLYFDIKNHHEPVPGIEFWLFILNQECHKCILHFLYKSMCHHFSLSRANAS